MTNFTQVNNNNRRPTPPMMRARQRPPDCSSILSSSCDSLATMDATETASVGAQRRFANPANSPGAARDSTRGRVPPSNSRCSSDEESSYRHMSRNSTAWRGVKRSTVTQRGVYNQLSGIHSSANNSAMSSDGESRKFVHALTFFRSLSMYLVKRMQLNVLTRFSIVELVPRSCKSLLFIFHITFFNILSN